MLSMLKYVLICGFTLRCTTGQHHWVPSLELIFAIDDSGSSSSNPTPYRETMLKFMVTFVENYTAGPGESKVKVIRVAAIEFGNTTKIHFLFQTNVSLLNTKILGLKSRNFSPVGEANTADGIFNIMSLFGNITSGDKPEATDVIAIIITDGKSTYGPRALQFATKAKKKGIKIFVIGLTSQLNETQIKLLSSEPQRINKSYWIISDFQSLDSSVHSIVNQICKLGATSMKLKRKKRDNHIETSTSFEREVTTNLTANITTPSIDQSGSLDPTQITAIVVSSLFFIAILLITCCCIWFGCLKRYLMDSCQCYCCRKDERGEVEPFDDIETNEAEDSSTETNKESKACSRCKLVKCICKPWKEPIILPTQCRHKKYNRKHVSTPLHPPRCDRDNGHIVIPCSPRHDRDNGHSIPPHPSRHDRDNGHSIPLHSSRHDRDNGHSFPPHSLRHDRYNGHSVPPHSSRHDRDNGHSVPPRSSRHDRDNGHSIPPHSSRHDRDNGHSIPLHSPRDNGHHCYHHHYFHNQRRYSNCSLCYQYRGPIQSTPSPSIETPSINVPSQVKDINVKIYNKSNKLTAKVCSIPREGPCGRLNHYVHDHANLDY